MTDVIRVALYQPEIPPNTGNIIRLCANTGAELHLIEPLGFSMEDRLLRRAGLDYAEFASVTVHADLNALIETVAPARVLAITTRGRTHYSDIRYNPDDLLLFGPETRGLPRELLATLPDQQLIRIPMRADSRSLNLSNAAAVIVYHAWWQQGFRGGY